MSDDGRPKPSEPELVDPDDLEFGSRAGLPRSNQGPPAAKAPEVVDPDDLEFGSRAGLPRTAAGPPSVHAPDPADADSLDAGLGVAFGAVGRRPGEGVAAAIDRMTGGAPRVLLPDDGDDPSPMLRVVAGGADRLGEGGRYEALGEIARGGLGVVLKARDRDLGRDVAVKVLRPEFAKNDAVLARFVEEAQIGGQLQHPGLVPVYSIGLDAEGRPFFAMKLVKGRTLASMLVDRKSPRDGQRRLLAVFESVCRTMAYAHSRRVVHRDLKPSNVMLGAFGEVQVVDWGLAKVLGREDVPGVRRAADVPDISLIATVRSGSAGSGSLAGSVLGTPGYLSPEQALGRIEDVDERTDVFALGSMLCEILTGEPAFMGDARDQILLAARGQTEDAQARLEKCGADPAIVAIAKKCLASERGERYRDAGALADAVTAHLSGAEARARQAELAAAEARAKAEEERTLAAHERSQVAREHAAQRRTFVLSGVALAAVAGAVVLWRNQAVDEADRVGRASAAVSDALADANAKRGARDLVGALAAAQKAAALAKTGGVEAATAERAAKLVADVEAEQRAAETAAAQAAKDEAFAAAMARARDTWEEGDEYAEATAQRFAAFREYGVDLEKCDVEEGAASLRASPRLAEMAAVLDHWVVRSRESQAEHPISAEAGALVVRIDRIVRAADPDPWRSRLRDAMKTGVGDKAVVRALANEPDIEKQPDVTLDWMTWAFNRLGDSETILSLGRIQERRHPGQPWLGIGSLASATLGSKDAKPVDADDLSAAWTARLALHPGIDRWRQLGNALKTSREPAAAIAAFGEAVRLNPQSYGACADLGNALHREQGDFDGRLKELADRMVSLDPKRAEAHYFLGKIFQRSRDFAAAEALLRKSVALWPDNASAHRGLADVLEDARKFDECIAECRTAARLDPSPANTYALVRILAFHGLEDEAVATGKRAFERLPNDSLIVSGYSLAVSAAARKASAAGDTAKALAFADTAVEMARRNLASSPRNAATHKDLARALKDRAEIAGTVCQEAIDEFLESIRLEPHPRWPYAHQAHEWLAGELRRIGRYEEARTEFTRALRIFPFCPEANTSYGTMLHQELEEYKDGVRFLRNAIALAPDYVEAWNSLILALVNGRAASNEIEAECKRCAEALAKSSRGPPTAETDSDAAYAARQLARLVDPQFPEVVRRGLKPADRAEVRELEYVCSHRRLYAAAWRLALYGLSTACKPAAKADSATRWELYYDGACAAALAANGDGVDADSLDAAERPQIRRQAFEWLREACALEASEVWDSVDWKAAKARNSRAHARVDPDFASVRDPEALAKLPAADRAAWERLWAEIDRAVRSFSQRTK